MFQVVERASSLGGNQLEWAEPTSVTAILDYNLQRKTGEAGTFTDLPTQTGMFLIDNSGITAHIYRIRARNAAGFGPWSEDAPVDSTGRDDELLTVPRELTAVRQAGGAVLTWRAPLMSGYVLYQYQVQRKVGTGSFVNIGSPLSADVEIPTYTDTTIEASLTYTYKIRAFAPAGLSPIGISILAAFEESAEVILIDPSASPPVISASVSTLIAVADTAITDITIDATSGGAVVSYSIAPDIAMTPGLAFSSTTGTISGTPTAEADEVSYTITATNDNGTDTATVAITVARALPGKAVVFQVVERASSLGGNQLEWHEPTSATAILDYNLQRKTGEAGTFTDLPTQTGMFLIDNTGITSHIYRIRARNAAGFGPWSEDAPVDSTGRDDELLTVPRELTAVRQDGGAVLTWRAPLMSGYVLYQYQVQRKVGTGSFVDIGSPLSADVEIPTYTDTTIEASLTYTYKIRAFAPQGLSPIGITILAAFEESAEVILTPVVPLINASTNALAAKVGRAITAITLDASGGGVVVSYSINPDIANGLTFDTTSGTISGTPTAVADEVSYTITATNADGMDTATVAITVNPLALPGKMVVFQVVERASSLGGNQLEWHEPTSVTAILDYNLQRKTGEAGTFTDLPTQTMLFLIDNTGITAHIYRIRARNDDGFGPWSEDAPVDSTGRDDDLLTEPRELTAVRRAGDAVLTWRAPLISGLVLYQYQVQRKVGTGSFVDIGSPLSADVEIPTYTDTTIEASLTYTYKIRAFAPQGLSPIGITILAASEESAEVILIAPPLISASTTTLTATVGMAITAITLDASGGGTVDSYSIAPDLPSGLAFDTGSGTISGMPTAAAGAVEYTITATNDDGMDTATVTITVEAALAAPVITASVPMLIATMGTAIIPVTIDATGGAVDSYSIAPALPSGLAFDTTSGTISGSPTAVAGAVEYTITGTNAGGTAVATATVTITVTATLAAPVITASVPTLSATADTAITPVTIDSTGGEVASYSIDPDIAMTPGLEFDATTGTISGSPTAAAVEVEYTITATNDADSDTATVTITVTAAPTFSDFAATATVLEVVLTWEVSDGGSDITGYTLTRTPGSAAAETITPPPAIDVTTITDTVPTAGDYTYSLIATNGIGPSTAATVTVTATNAGPTADAGDAQTVAEGATVMLDGSGSSDPESETLTYAWTQTSGADVTLSSATAAEPTFIAPSDLVTNATLVFSLIVTDARNLASTADTVTIIVTAGDNDPPTANAGPDQSGAAEGVSVTLDGSGSSDPESETLTYTWTQTAPATGERGSGIILSGADTAAPTFIVPIELVEDATLTFSLTVTDASSLVSTTADSVSVSVIGTNDAPTANAGPDRAVAEGSSVTLDGSGSSDPENQALTYAWEQTSGTAVTLSSSTAATPTFTAPNLSASATLVFSLTVTDAGSEASEVADSVSITVTAAPTAEAGDAQTVAEGVSVTLDGSASSDPENEALTYAWTQTAPTVAQGAGITLSGANTAAPTFTTPSNLVDEATLVFSLTVTDASGLASTADTVSITVTAVNDSPTANAGDAQTVAEGDSVTLNGSASSDPESETLTYAWTQSSGTAVTLSSTTAAAPTFTAPNNLTANATLVFSLVVTDARGLVSTPDTVTITVSLPTPDGGSGSDGSTPGSSPLALMPDFGPDLGAEGLAVVHDEIREITISGGISPYRVVLSSDDSTTVDAVVDAVIGGTTLRITGTKVGLVTLIIQDLRTGSIELKVKVLPPQVLNSEDGAVFRGGVSEARGNVYFHDGSFSVGEAVNIIFAITPRTSDPDSGLASDVGKQASIVVAGRMASNPDDIMLLNEAGLLVPYDGETLVSFMPDHTLAANNLIYITPNPFTLTDDLAGNWEVFIGYQLANGDVFHTFPLEPLKIEVTR